jgi:maltose phosphorylase
VWAALVHGFAGMADTVEHLRFAPRLPGTWTAMRFRLQRHGSQLLVELDADGATITVEAGGVVPITGPDGLVALNPGETLRIDRDGGD